MICIVQSFSFAYYCEPESKPCLAFVPGHELVSQVGWKRHCLFSRWHLFDVVYCSRSGVLVEMFGGVQLPSVGRCSRLLPFLF